jgi:choline dehydrogenase-like flavoprotein
MQEQRAFQRLYQDRGNRASADLSIAVLQGRSVGGGTVVNWTTSYRTPDDVLQFWRDKEGSILTPEALKPHFEEIEKRLNVTKVDYEDTNPNNRTIYDGCKKLGWQVDTIKRNVRGCLRTGYCGMGCPVDAKQSAALTYLPDAVAKGAEIYANCRVEKIETDGKRAVVAVGHFLDPRTQQPTGKTIRVRPRVLVVSGGALNSPALLLLSGITQGPVGKKTWLHPTIAMGAFYKDAIEGFYGAPQSVASHQFAHRPEGAGFFIEAAPVHPMLSSIATAGFGAGLRGKLSRLPNLCATISLMIDGFGDGEEGGTVTLRKDSGPRLDYPFTPRMSECFRAGMKAIARLHLANGAERIDTFHNDSIHIYKESDIALIDERPIGPNLMAAFTAHQMGGCRMGADPSRSVVDPHLKHHAFDNLFVIDGSVFPTGLGVNPMESIYGVASWASEHVHEALS